MEHGAQWHAPGFHSGYNELTVNSKAYNPMLPDSVLGFFYVKGTSLVTADLGHGISMDVRAVHRSFLARYNLKEHNVPLIEFDLSSWNTHTILAGRKCSIRE